MEQIEYIDIKDQNGNLIFKINNPKEVAFIVEETSANSSLFNSLCSGVGKSAAEASKAFRNLSMQITCATKSLEQFVDAYNNIGCTSFNMTSDEIKTMLDDQKNNQVRPATDEKSENPNQKSLFDFLEQNAYEEIDSELLASFDSI